MPDRPIYLNSDVDIELVYPQGTCEVDCRLLFLGDHWRQLARTYEEIARRFSRARDKTRLWEDLRSSAEIQQLYEIHRSKEEVSVTMRDTIFRQRGPLDDLGLQVRASRGAASILRLLPLNRMRALGCLLPLIRKGLSEDEIGQALQERLAREESQWAVEILLWLKATGWLSSTPNDSNVFLRPSRRPRVVFMGHSSLLFQSEQSAVLVDPILRPNLRLPRSAFDVTRIKLRAICCTHSHWDHCDLQTLLWFDKDTPIYIPAVKRPTAFNPPIKPALSLLGFTDIREVHPWEHHQIDDIEFIPVPFHGEQDEPDAEIDHHTFVLRAAGATIYGGVDTFQDSRGQMKPVLEKIRELYHPTVAFLPVSKMMYWYRTGGVNGFCRYLDTSLLNQSFQYTAAAEDAAEWMTVLKSKWVAPYATFTFSPWSTPREVSEFARALRSVGLTDTLFPLRVLDSLVLSSGAHAWSTGTRRILLAAWFHAGAGFRKFDRRLQKNRVYGLFRKAVRYLSTTHP